MAAEDLAKVGYEVDSSGLKKGTSDVDKFGAANEKASKKTKGFGGALSHANDNMLGLIRTTNNANRSVNLFNSAMGALVRQAGLLGAAIGAAFSLKEITAFKDALAEVSTLVDTTTFNMQALEASAISQSAAFGGTATAQAKAFYQIISAGASSAAQATDILTASNKLAVGGVTSVTTAADGLTSVLNAYGSKVEGATAVSDALFVAMRAGKTTIGELSSGLGKVAPLAAQTNVSFDELVASISALTKGGIATSEAITGVRAILAAVSKPTKEASDLAKQLGIQFNSAGLQAKGLQGFLNDLVKRTGGSTDALAQLFGGVEALVPAMALSGQAGRDFSAIMDQMGNKAGSTQVAFDKMANSPGFQSGRVWSSLKAEVLSVASGLSGPLTKGLKAVADNMGTIVSTAETAGVVLLAAFGPAILGAVSSLAVMIGTTLVGAVVSLTAAVAANPLGAMAVAAVALGKVIYDNRQQIMEFIGLVDNSAAAAAASMAATSSKAQGMVNSLKEAEAKYQEAIKGTSGAQTQASAANLSNMSKEIAKKKEQIALELQHQKALQATQQAQIESVGRQLRADVGSRYLNNTNIYASGYADRRVGRLTQVPTGRLSQTLESSPYYSQMQDLQSGARATENSIRLLEEALNSTFTGSEKEVEATAASFIDLGKKAKTGMSAAEKAAKKMQEAVLSAKNTLGQGFGGILQGLITKSLTWKDALIQAGQALLRYFNQMNIAQGGSGLFGGGLFGGLVQGLLGFKNGAAFAGGVQKFANGGSFTNSIVSKPTLFPFANGTGMMGEAGPEAIMPLSRDSRGRLGVVSANQGGGGNVNQDVSVNTRVTVGFDETTLEPSVRRISQEESTTITGTAVQSMQKSLPNQVSAIMDQKQSRGYV